jgi:hypothetical protein
LASLTDALSGRAGLLVAIGFQRASLAGLREIVSLIEAEPAIVDGRAGRPLFAALGPLLRHP